VPGALRYIHELSDWKKNCYVDLNATDASDREAYCILETTELDLMHLGVQLKYNVPAFESCSYVTQDSPYFFKYPAVESDGTSLVPTDVTYTYDATGAIKTDSSYTATIEGTTYTGAAAIAKMPIINNQPTCAYNHGALLQDNTAPNCCEGNYDYTAGVDDGTTVTYTTGTGAWGGKSSNCLAGPAMKIQPINNDGWPRRIIYRMENQASILSTVGTSNTDRQRGNSSHFVPMNLEELRKLVKQKKFRNSALGRSIKASDLTSSAFNTFETTTENFGGWDTGSNLLKDYHSTMFAANWTDSASLSIRAFTDLTNYFSEGDTRPIVWTCYDDAYENYASLKVYIREWNKYSNLLSAYTNKTEPASGFGSDDTTGTETDHPSESINDWADWEDLKSGASLNFPKGAL
jgi:hypothetical protein